MQANTSQRHYSLPSAGAQPSAGRYEHALEEILAAGTKLDALERQHRRLKALAVLACVACPVCLALGWFLRGNGRTPDGDARTQPLAAPTLLNEPAQSSPGPRATAFEDRPARDESTLAASRPAVPLRSDTSAQPGNRNQGATFYYVQVIASASRPQVKSVVIHLLGLGYPALVVTPDECQRDDSLFRGQVGPFALRDEAEEVQEQLAAQGLSGFVTARKMVTLEKGTLRQKNP